jgi:hypothetical protein
MARSCLLQRDEFGGSNPGLLQAINWTHRERHLNAEQEIPRSGPVDLVTTSGRGLIRISRRKRPVLGSLGASRPYNVPDNRRRPLACRRMLLRWRKDDATAEGNLKLGDQP